jgi:hypothetical protein
VFGAIAHFERRLRFCYVSGGPHECFQVSIERPEGTEVLVNAWTAQSFTSRPRRRLRPLGDHSR